MNKGKSERSCFWFDYEEDGSSCFAGYKPRPRDWDSQSQREHHGCSCTTILHVFPSRKKPCFLENFNFTTGYFIVLPLGNSGQSKITAATVQAHAFSQMAKINS